MKKLILTFAVLFSFLTFFNLPKASAIPIKIKIWASVGRTSECKNKGVCGGIDIGFDLRTGSTLTYDNATGEFSIDFSKENIAKYPAIFVGRSFVVEEDFTFSQSISKKVGTSNLTIKKGIYAMSQSENGGFLVDFTKPIR